MQQKIINNFDRKKLGEGRCYGLGYAFLKKLDNNDYETLMAFTACKDYLNDFVYVEGSGNALEIAYGFKHEYIGLLKDQEYVYLGLRALHYNSGSVYNKYDLVQNTLKDNYTNIIKAIHKLEQFFGLKDLTQYEDYVDGTLILKMPVYWFKFSFMFSMYGLFIRCFMNITDEELKLSLEELTKKKDTLIVADGIMLNPMHKFFTKPNIEKLLNYEYPKDPNSYIIHNYGINSRLAQVNEKTI